MEGMSSDDENDLLSSDEEGGNSVEIFTLCSFAHPAHSPLLQGFLDEAEVCEVALTCHFDHCCDLSLCGLGGSPRLELSL